MTAWYSLETCEKCGAKTGEPCIDQRKKDRQDKELVMKHPGRKVKGAR